MFPDFETALIIIFGENTMKKLLIAGILISLLIIAGCASSGGSASGGASGTATASAQGFGGEIKVTVTMEKGKITKVEADGPSETQGVGSRAVINLPAQMVAKNSVAVDVVGGATVSSQAILTAAKAAMDQIK